MLREFGQLAFIKASKDVELYYTVHKFGRFNYNYLEALAKKLIEHMVERDFLKARIYSC